MARTPGTYAILETTEGNIVCRLFPEDAPKTVKNFIELAEGKRDWNDSVSGKKGPGPLFSGTVFHRVIPNFMIQGGDPSGTGTGGPGYKFEDETKNSSHKFDRTGKLAMANSGPNTNGSQFFVTVAPTPWLTGNHTIFGEVIEGQEIADKISKAARNSQDRPKQDVVLNAVKIEQI
jgi:peptidyl-prolyl cis-trans isomerase A (cyclophilin A)